MVPEGKTCAMRWGTVVTGYIMDQNGEHPMTPEDEAFWTGHIDRIRALHAEAARAAAVVTK